MNTLNKKWKVLGKLPKAKKKISEKDIINYLLKSRGIETPSQRKEFLKPIHPDKLSLKKLKIKKEGVDKAIARLKKAKKNKEKVIVYGDYDADGITGSAILWERLHALGIDTMPYLPDRFKEGYGLNPDTIARLKEELPELALIISVDNGIVATKAVKKANELGVDVILTDHHQLGKKIPEAYAIVHTDLICGSALAWIFAREISKAFKLPKSKLYFGDGLGLAGIGTVADMVPLVGANRSFAKYGLEALNNTTRPGLISLFTASGLKPGSIDSYSIGFVISPRINAMGKLKHGMDSLRLLCTRNQAQAEGLAMDLQVTNNERRKILGEVVIHAKESARLTTDKCIVVAHSEYHEGVVGLAASRLVEHYYRPSIVISRGKKVSKASARSVSGFNIIKALQECEDLLLNVGGHPMAAGFSIETKNIDKFTQEFNKKAAKAITEKALLKEIKIDLEIEFPSLSKSFAKTLAAFEPTGIGNPAPTFMTKDVVVIDARTVGGNGKHLKLKVRKEGKLIEAIAFGFGELSPQLSLGKTMDIAYRFEENVWNGSSKLQLNIKDIQVK